VGDIVLIVFFVLRGDDAPNKYGPPAGGQQAAGMPPAGAQRY
jgi:uncharacterized membrane protein YhaH (DUF805 family)